MRLEKVSDGMLEVLYVAHLLRKEADCNPSRREIAKKIQKSAVCVGGYVKRLQERGLVMVHGRFKGVQLTRAGRDYLLRRIEVEKAGKV